MFKNNKSVSIFCGALSISGVASNLVQAQITEPQKQQIANDDATITESKILNYEVVLEPKSLTNKIDNENSFKNTNVNIVLIGPPGSGKGTNFETIAARYGLTHYSTGDMLRAEVSKGSKEGKIAESYMKQGKLVPSNIIEELTRTNLLNSETGHVIDGSPRTVAEAKFLDDLGLNIGAVIYLDVKDEDIIKRLSGRRVCACGNSYHVLYNKPKEDGICDKCGQHLYQRHDDEMNVVKERLKIFHEKTEPVLDYYEKQGKLIKIDGSGNIDNVKTNLLNALDSNEHLKILTKD